MEKQLGVQFPSDFRSFIQQYDGGYPQPDCLTTGKLGLVIKEFFKRGELRSTYLKGVVEFARSPFGDDYAISCRRVDLGCIYFIDHEAADPDSLSLRLAGAVRTLPAGFAQGVTRIAKSFTSLLGSLHFGPSDWVEYLLQTDPERFRHFINEVGTEFKDEIGRPVVSLVAQEGTRADLEWIYDQGARAEDLICYAVRNTRDTLNVLRFLLSRGENATFAYQPGKPYAIGYAKQNDLPEVVALLREYGVSDTL